RRGIKGHPRDDERLRQGCVRIREWKTTRTARRQQSFVLARTARGDESEDRGARRLGRSSSRRCRDLLNSSVLLVVGVRAWLTLRERSNLPPPCGQSRCP